MRKKRRRRKRILIFVGIVLLIILIDYGRINISYYLSKKDFVESFDVHGNKSGFVPQGLSYSEKYNVILQTSYSKEMSKLFIINFDNGELLKEIFLLNKDGSYNNKHVGGIATNDSLIWISNDYEIDIYSLEDIMNNNESRVKSIEQIKLPIRGDFCYFYDNILWIGDFYQWPIYNVPNKDPKLNGYKYDDEIDYSKPDYTLSLPERVQGMTILPSGEFLFTKSFTYLEKSTLSVYKNILDTGDTSFDKEDVVKNITLPPMAEGMFYKDGYIYILFESSTDKYTFAYPKIKKVLKYKMK